MTSESIPGPVSWFENGEFWLVPAIINYALEQRKSSLLWSRKLEAGRRKSENWGQESEIENRELEVGNRKSKIGRWKLEVGSPSSAFVVMSYLAFDTFLGGHKVR